MNRYTKTYTTFAVKEASEDGQRIVKGIASTQTPDRDGDIVEPSGANFALPIPLLWQHDREKPIGEVVAAQVTEKGIE
ncbi:TPA: peptidase U35, partial [Neisseria gonorrhoeae]